MKKTKFRSYDEMSKAVAETIISAISKKPNLVLGLPTGSTPIGMYQHLVKAYQDGRVDFSQVITFNLDEYVGLEEDHEQSYHFFMKENLFKHINVKKENIHIPTGNVDDLTKVALEYDHLIEEAGGIDLFIVGIGQNGHIGFNEPSLKMPSGTHVVKLTESTINANARLFNNNDEVPKFAITQGMATILKAKEIVLLASGPSKTKAVNRMLRGELTLKCPATLLNLHSNVKVFVTK